MRQYRKGMSAAAESLKSKLTARRHQIKYRVGAILLGVALIGGPAIYSRQQVVDLGPRVVLVGGEKHITLTGWDGESYTVLD